MDSNSKEEIRNIILRLFNGDSEQILDKYTAIIDEELMPDISSIFAREAGRIATLVLSEGLRAIDKKPKYEFSKNKITGCAFTKKHANTININE